MSSTVIRDEQSYYTWGESNIKKRLREDEEGIQEQWSKYHHHIDRNVDQGGNSRTDDEGRSDDEGCSLEDPSAMECTSLDSLTTADVGSIFTDDLDFERVFDECGLSSVNQWGEFLSSDDDGEGRSSDGAGILCLQKCAQNDKHLNLPLQSDGAEGKGPLLNLHADVTFTASKANQGYITKEIMFTLTEDVKEALQSCIGDGVKHLKDLELNQIYTAVLSRTRPELDHPEDTHPSYQTIKDIYFKKSFEFGIERDAFVILDRFLCALFMYFEEKPDTELDIPGIVKQFKHSRSVIAVIGDDDLKKCAMMMIILQTFLISTAKKGNRGTANKGPVTERTYYWLFGQTSTRGGTSKRQFKDIEDLYDYLFKSSRCHEPGRFKNV